MNPGDWDNIGRGLQRDRERKPCIGEKTEAASRNRFERDPCSGYSRTTFEGQQTSPYVEWDHHQMSTYRGGLKESIDSTSEEGTDLNGEVLEMTEDDLELARKRKMLQEIEEQIMLKKAAIALRKLEPYLNSNTLFSVLEESITEERSIPDMSMQNELFLQEAGYSETKHAFDCRPGYNGSSLKERVNVILHKRPPCSFHSKAPKVEYYYGLNNLSDVKKDTVRPSEHPLKFRVKSLMRKRHCSLTGEDPDVEPEPSSQTPALKELEKNSVSEGFQRFLSVLNKGVDLNLLSKIVTDTSDNVLSGSGELLDIQQQAVENESILPGEHHSGAWKQDTSRSSSRERGTESLSRKGSHSTGGHTPPGEARCGQATDAVDDHFSPPGVTSDVPQEVEREKCKLDEQHGQLQHILKTLGLSFEDEELSKLTDRTQERLYGKRDERQRVDPKTQVPDEPESYPVCRGGSFASDSRDGQTHEGNHDESQDGESFGDVHEMNYGGNYPSYSSYSAYPCPEITSSNTAYRGGTYSNTDPTWTVPCAPHNSSDPHQNPSYNAYSTVSPHVLYPQAGVFLNPDLSACEGQNGGQFGPRCLQSVNAQYCLMPFAKVRKTTTPMFLPEIDWHNLNSTRQLKRMRQKEKIRQKVRCLNLTCIKVRTSEDKAKPLTEDEAKPLTEDEAKPLTEDEAKPLTEDEAKPLTEDEAKPLTEDEAKPLTEDEAKPLTEDEAKPLTEEVVKSNLKKKLEEFNQKMKEKKAVD